MSTKKEYPSRKSSEKASPIEMTTEITSNLDQLLDEKFKTFKSDILKELTELIGDSVKYHIAQLEEKYDNKYNDLETKLRTQMANFSNQTSEIQELKKSTLELRKANEKLEEKLEEQTNRGLRNTLIFKNIEEEKDEKWKETTEKVVTAIKKASKNSVTFEDALDMIERSHRGNQKNKNKTAKDRRPRPVYALISDWRHAEQLREYFLKKPKSMNIFCEQMYGPRTTWRRNKALAKRKEMKANGEITSGFVSYPAKLMVKKRGNDSYTLEHDFSEEKVDFNN